MSEMSKDRESERRHQTDEETQKENQDTQMECPSPKKMMKGLGEQETNITASTVDLDQTTSIDMKSNGCGIASATTTTTDSSRATTGAADDELRLPDADTQNQMIRKLSKINIDKGQVWNVLCMKWFKNWKNFVGYENHESVDQTDHFESPGPVDNCEILQQYPNILKKNLNNGKDFFLMPAEAYAKLDSWYGLASGQAPIRRTVIKCNDLFDSLIKVEVYPTQLSLCLWGSQTRIEHNFSLADTLENVEKEVRAVFDIPKDKELKLWDTVYGAKAKKQVNLLDTWSKHTTLYSIRLRQGRLINIEIKNDDGSWPKQM